MFGAPGGPAGWTSSPSSGQKSAERGAGCGAAGVQPRVCPRRPRPPPSSLPSRPPWPWVPAVAPSGGRWLPSHACPGQHTPCSPPLSEGPLSLFLPSRRRSQLLYLFARDQSLPPRTCLGGEWPAPSSRPAPALLPFGERRVLFPAPCGRSGPPDIPESSPRARARSCLLLPSLAGAGGGGFRVELPGVLFYSFNSFTFPFLLCVAFTYLLIYNRSGPFPSCAVYGFRRGCAQAPLRLPADYPSLHAVAV